MKKKLLLLSLIVVLGFAATQVFAWNGRAMHRGYNPAQCPLAGSYGNYGPEQQKFFEETQELRTSLRADRAELNAILAGSDPDPQRVRELTENIARAQIQLASKARANNAFSRQGFGHRGYGRHMKHGGYGAQGQGPGGPCW